MRINSAESIKTANTVRARFGSWKAAKDWASYEGGKFVVRSVANDRSTPINGAATKTP